MLREHAKDVADKTGKWPKQPDRDLWTGYLALRRPTSVRSFDNG